MAAMTFAISVHVAPTMQAQKMQPCRPLQCSQHTSSSGEMAFPCRLKNVWVGRAQCPAFTDIFSVLSCEQCAKLLQKPRAKKRKLRVHEYKRLPHGHRAPHHSQVKNSSFVTSKVRHDAAPAHKDSTTRIKPRPTFFQNPCSMYFLI